MNNLVERLQVEHFEKIELLKVKAAKVLADTKAVLPATLAAWGNGMRYMDGGWDCTVYIDEDSELMGRLNNGAIKTSRHYREASYPFESEYPLRALGSIGLKDLQTQLETPEMATLENQL